MRAERRVNLGDITQRAILIEELSTAAAPGVNAWHNVSITPARPKASQHQHGYYRAVLVPLAKTFLNATQGGDDDGDDFDEESTHNWLKNYLRPIPVVNRKTGEELGVTTKSHSLYTVAEMAEFIDDVTNLLVENGVRVPKPDKNYREMDEQQDRRNASLAWA